MAQTFAKRVTGVTHLNSPDATGPKWFPCAASQTWSVGDLVYLDGSGLLTLCGADPADILGIVCRANAASAASTLFPVEIITPETFVTMTALEGSGADHVWAQTDVNVASDLVKSSAGKWAVEVGGSGGTRVQIVKAIAGAAAGDTNVPVLVKFTSTNLQFYGT